MAPLIKKKDKHSTGRLGQGHEHKIHKSNKSRDNYVCILTKCLEDSKILPGSRY